MDGSPRVVVNPFAAAQAAAATPPTPASAPTSAYAMQAMVAELQRSQAALAKLRAENRQYKVKEELENAPMSGGILAWSEQRAVSTMQTANLCNGALLIAAAIGSLFIPGETAVATFALVVLVCYMVFLGCIMIAMEIRISDMQAMVRERFGFLFTYKGRSCFIVFSATVVMATANLSVAGGPGNVTLWSLAVLTLANALFNFCVVMRHPAFTSNPQRYAAPLSAVDAKAAEERITLYLLQHPEVVLRVAQRSAAEAHQQASRMVAGPQRRMSMANPSGAAAAAAASPRSAFQPQQLQQQQLQQERGRQAQAGGAGATPRAKSAGPTPSAASGNPFAVGGGGGGVGAGGGGAATAAAAVTPSIPRERRKSFAGGKVAAAPDASNSWLWGGGGGSSSGGSAAAARSAAAAAAAAARPAVADWRGTTSAVSSPNPYAQAAAATSSGGATPSVPGSFRDSSRKKSFVNPFDSPRYKGGL